MEELKKITEGKLKIYKINLATSVLLNQKENVIYFREQIIKLELIIEILSK